MKPETDQTSTTLLPLLLGAAAVGKLIGVSCRTVWSMHQCGQLPLPVKVRGRTMWRRQEIEAWVRAGCPRRDKWVAIWSGE